MSCLFNKFLDQGRIFFPTWLYFRNLLTYENMGSQLFNKFSANLADFRSSNVCSAKYACPEGGHMATTKTKDSTPPNRKYLKLVSIHKLLCDLALKLNFFLLLAFNLIHSTEVKRQICLIHRRKEATPPYRWHPLNLAHRTLHIYFSKDEVYSKLWLHNF